MKTRVLALSIVALMLQTAAVRAAEATVNTSTTTAPAEEGRIHLMPSLGFALVNPAAVNDMLAHTIKINDASPTGELKGSALLSVAADYALTNNFSAGVRLDYADVKLDRSLSVNDATFSDTTELSSLVPYVTATARTELRPGMFAGLTGGAGTPIFYHLGYSYQAKNLPGLDKASATYGASPFAGYLAAFGTLELSRTALARAEVGYRFLDASSMAATGPGTDDAKNLKEGQTLKSNGQDVRVNASAPYVSVGVTFML